MGRRHLLFIVLGIFSSGFGLGCDTYEPTTLSDGLAVVYATAETPKSANARALTNDAVRIAVAAQVWSREFTTHGDVGAFSFEDLTFDQIGYKATDGIHRHENGKFNLYTGAAGSMLIAACDEQPTFDNLIVTVVTGASRSDITTYVATAACTF